MSNEFKQLDNLRRQAAKIRRYLANIENASNISAEQQKAAEITRITFYQIVGTRIHDKRREYNDENPTGFDINLDSYENTLDDPKNASVIIQELVHEISELKKLAEFVCCSNSDPLIIAIGDFWTFDFFEFKKRF